MTGGGGEAFGPAATLRGPGRTFAFRRLVGRDRSHWIVPALVIASAVETVIGLTRRLDDAGQFLAGDGSLEAVSGVIALLWMPVMITVLLLTVRQLGWFHRRTTQDAQAIAAAGATSHEWQWEASPDLVVTYSNDRVQDLLGYRPDEVVGRPIAELFADPEAPRALDLLRAGIENGTGWHDVEGDWRHADGHVVTLLGSASALTDGHGRVRALRGARRLLPESAAADRAREEIRSRVQAVLDDAAVRMALQPIRGIRSGELVGFEALARFADGSPGAMFADADEVGLGLELELLAVRTALPLLARLPEPTYLSVNASPELILDGRLIDLLSTPGVDLGRLVLEVTERAAVSRYDRLRTLLAPLRERGMRLAADDTGAGYASFHHVLELRPDIIKLDRSLIAGIDTDPAQRSLVIAVALLALDLRATLTAEGIETAAQLEALGNLGIDHGQGYHLGRPSLDLTPWTAPAAT